MSTLHFEKISKYDRLAEPVTVSIPFAPGKLNAPDCFVIRDGDRPLPLQKRALTHWSDGSVQWLLVHVQPDLPGNADKTLNCDLTDTPVAVEPGAAVRVEELDDRLRVDTGVLSFDVPRTGFWPLVRPCLRGQTVFGDTPCSGFTMRIAGESVATETAAAKLDIEESGPLRAVINIRMAPDPATGVEVRGRIVAHAGKSFVEVEHQFVYVGEDEETRLDSLSFDFRPEDRGPAARMIGEGFYRTRIDRREADDSSFLAMTINAETVLWEAWEHYPDSFYGDFWADWTNPSAGLTVTIHQAHQNFPKALEASPAGLDCLLYPESEAPCRILRGMGKTHRMQLHIHAPDAPAEQLSARSLQFQIPDIPSLPRSWYAANNPWREPFFPERIPDRLLTYLLKLHDSRPKALGMMHFGDAPDANYTNQGRGAGETVWVNNEYDRAHACALLYGLTGVRRTLDSGVVAARHWLDVDFCHRDDDPLRDGGLKIHTAYHGTGSVTPSHEWVEGPLDYYILTGRREGLEVAERSAEDVRRHMDQPKFSEPGAASVREVGWALRAMVGMALGTGEARWADEARRLADRLVAWRERHGALLAPYTDHSMPRVTFMIALTVNSLARYRLLDDRKDIRDLIVSAVDDLMAHCLGPDGIFYYKELPSLRVSSPTVHAIEALTHAYRITGRQEYLRVATRQFAATTAGPFPAATGGGSVKRTDASGAVIVGQGGGRVFAASYTSLLLFAAAAAPLGLLDWFEYPC